MICFIPAWYAENDWKEKEQQWYARRMHTEVDDTIKQLQLFNRKGVARSRTLVLNYAPNFRHFFHRQGLLQSDYWLCFDAIQNVSVRRPGILSFHNLNWPENIEFIYSPFSVIAMQNDHKFAQIDFGEDGNMIQIDLFQDDKMVRRNIYDDRGFLSSTIVFKNDSFVYEQYLDQKGIWRICRYADGHVTVNQKANQYLIQIHGEEKLHPYSKQNYDSMEAVVSEVFQAYVSHLSADTVFCIAMHGLHSTVLNETLQEYKKIVSFFNDRCCLIKDKASEKLAKQADYIVVNSKGIIKKTGLNCLPKKTNLVVITPFDTRVDFGHSQQLQQQNILLPVDNLDDETFEKMIIQLMEYMLTNDNVRVQLFTRNAAYDVEEKLLEKTGTFLEKNGYSRDYAKREKATKSENDIEEYIPVLFNVKQCVDELSASKCLQEQRLVIDMGRTPDLFLQIGAISMGIPQIVKVNSEYVVDGKNGRVIKDTKQLSKILPFYLDTLKNWNQAVIESYEIGKKFNSGVLVDQWKKVIEHVEQN